MFDANKSVGNVSRCMVVRTQKLGYSRLEVCHSSILFLLVLE